MPSPNNINRSIPAIPVDGNKRQASAVLLPIVNGSGTIVNYLPIKCTDNGDGTATLDVGLALNGEIDIGNVNLLNTANAKINPATEDTLASLNSKDFATQATLELIRLLLNGQLKIGSSNSQTSADKFISVDSSGRVMVTAGGVVSTGNSSTTPLGINGVFTGTAESCLSISHIIIMVKSDQPSATKGLKVEVSADGTTWNTLEEFTVPANKLKVYTLGPAGAFFRVRYINNSIAQSSFLLQTTLKPFSQKPSTHVISDSIADEDDAELVKAVITGVTESGIFKNAKVSDDGFLKVVLPPPTAPTGATPVQVVADSSMAGSVDTLYVIPNGSTLKIQQLRTGSQRTTSGGTKTELYYDPLGTGAGMTLIDKLFTDGNSSTSALDIEFIGDGTRTIRMRRTNFGGGSVEIFAAWRGYI